MKIIQLLPTISFGDAVSNDAIAIKNVIKELGYNTNIYAENIDRRLPKKTAEFVDYMPKLKKEDIIIYHGSTGTDLNYNLKKYISKKIMIYHNITPPEHFKKYNINAYKLTLDGVNGIKNLSESIDYCLAVSDFNKSNLIDMGYKCPIDVRPILIPFDDYKKTPNKEVINKYKDDWVNIVFIGRIAPNKKQEDIIKIFHYYKTFINKKSRLFIVGSYNGMENYYNRLESYVKILGTEDIHFTGHIKFDEILAYYNIADIFLCMSEHEGFCVPLVEAMFFNIPIVAYNSSAIPYTLNNSGILLDDKSPELAAQIIDRVINDSDLKKHILKTQQERLEDFSYSKVKNMFISYLNKFINSQI